MDATQLQTIRESLGYTRQEFAELLKTTYTTIYRWESGLRSIPPYLELAVKNIKPKKQINSLADERPTESVS